MQETLHIAFGFFLLKFLGNPWLVFPLAFLGHFFLDSIPHYKFVTKRKSIALALISVDAFFSLLLAYLYFIFVGNSLYIILGTLFFSAFPDFFLLMNYFFNKKIFKNFMLDFHKRIQHEYSWGWVVESIFLIALLFLIFS